MSEPTAASPPEAMISRPWSATLALFLVLGGGTALASYIISSNSQIGPGTVAGHKPPSGRHANIIAGSINATDLANGAVGPTKLAAVAQFARTNNGTTASTTVMTLAGLKIGYHCDLGSGSDFVPTLTAQTAANHAVITLTFTTGSDGFGSSFFDTSRDFLQSDSFSLTRGRSFGGGTLVYKNPLGQVVTMNYGFSYSPCSVQGVAIEG